MQRVIVYQEYGMFAGWPANHGAWQRGDEFLVGFLRGKHGDGAFHEIIEPFEKVQARSLDGGETWTVEVPNVDFNCAIEPIRTGPPTKFDGTCDIARVCGRYDTGGETCVQQGGFYVSRDFGREWLGPYPFLGLETIFGGDNHNTSRTRVIGNRFYLSSATQDKWGSDWVFSALLENGVFRLWEIVCKDRDRNARAVMPDVVQLDKLRVCVMRRKGRGRNWIDAFGSVNGGLWNQLAANCVADTGFANGNPPALAEVNGRLVCCYGNRSTRRMYAKASDDGGLTWRGHKVLNQSTNRDLGYPQLFKRKDGQLVCVYYISKSLYDSAHIEACIFDPMKMHGLDDVERD